MFSFKNENSDKSKWLSGVELAALYNSFVEKYPIVSIEVSAARGVDPHEKQTADCSKFHRRP